MKRLITYLIVIAATLYTAILYGSTSFLMLFYIELVLPVLLILINIPLARGAWVQLRLPIPVVEQGQDTLVELLLSNKAILPSGRIAIQITCHYPMNQKSEKVWFYGSVSAGSSTNPAQGKIRAWYFADCVGNVKMEITKVRCYDLLGLVGLPLSGSHWKQIEPETLLILPKITEVPVFVSRQSRDFAGESEEYAKDRGGDDPSETFQIRDYQPGDKLRSIHWKLSAKTENLMVCERSLPLGCPVTFYLDLYQSGAEARRNKRNRKRRGKAIKRDSYLQIVASVSHAMVREGCYHYIIWFDVETMDIQRYRVETEEDVYDMLLHLGKLSLYSQERNLEELYQQKYHESPCITRLELQMDLNLYKNGEVLVKYSDRKDKLKKQLGETEIMV